ncbi:MAG: hypothetical protein C5S48_07640 [Candidatus Methanogaster sp.]|nr:MAG: hypothetical protein C5S48_07640 [ANME-2 cluster archaeon]
MKKMNVNEAFDRFSTILSEYQIKELAKKYGVEDERERKLLVVPFFLANGIISDGIKTAGLSIKTGSLLYSDIPHYSSGNASNRD